MTKKVTPGDSGSKEDKEHIEEEKKTEEGRKEGKEKDRATRVQHSSGQAQAPCEAHTIQSKQQEKATVPFNSSSRLQMTKKHFPLYVGHFQIDPGKQIC